jgi:hypothetical protein
VSIFACAYVGSRRLPPNHEQRRRLYLAEAVLREIGTSATRDHSGHGLAQIERITPDASRLPAIRVAGVMPAVVRFRYYICASARPAREVGMPKALITKCTAPRGPAVGKFSSFV